MLTLHKILYPVVEGEYRNEVHLKEGKYICKQCMQGFAACIRIEEGLGIHLWQIVFQNV